MARKPRSSSGRVALARVPSLLDVSANVSHPYYRFVYLDQPWLTDPFAVGDGPALATLGPSPASSGPARPKPCASSACVWLSSYMRP